MDDIDSRFLDLIHSLELITDTITAERAHAQFGETTIPVLWKQWPGGSASAGSLPRMLSEKLAGPTTPQRDPELDEVKENG